MKEQSTLSRAYEALFDPNYRVNRREHLAGAIYLFVLMVINQLAFADTTGFIHFIGVVWYLGLVVMNIILTKNRFNDCGWSGWWMLFPFAALIIFFVPGDKSANKYGVRHG